MNKRILASTIVISIILMTLLTSLGFAMYNTNVNDTLEIIDNQIVYNGKTLTSSPDNKQFVCLSPNGQKIAFLNNKDWGNIGIIDLKTEEIIYASLENVFSTTPWGIDWVDNNRVAYYGHVNPDLDVYCIFNATTGERIKKYNGIGFTWNKQKTHIYYTLPQPHFSDSKGENKIIMDDDTIYMSDNDTMILGGPGISESEDTVSFFESKLSSGKLSLVVAKKSTDKKINVTKKIGWNLGRGIVTVNNDGTVDITTRFERINYDVEKEKILKIEKFNE